MCRPPYLILTVIFLGTAFLHSINAQEKSNLEKWEDGCVAEYKKDLEIYGRHARSQRRILTISICISKLSRPCIRFLNEVCPAATAENIRYIQEYLERINIEETLKSFRK